ncbi:MAG TPA: exopolysaccharide transport family protein [Pseudolabrys sp.]|nr:exopolysaccharide transport family protein [Pseudolabrys sp.]
MFRKKSMSDVPPPQPVLVQPVALDGEIDLRGLGRLLWQRKLIILGVTLACAAVAFVVVNTMTPRYRSEARILLDARPNVFLRARADQNIDSTVIDPETVTSQVQVLLSRDLAREVIQKEKLDQNPEFDPALGGRSPLRTLLTLVGLGRSPSKMTRDERTLEAYYDRLNVQAVDKSRVIVIDFTSANPQLASDVANTIAQTYLRMQQLEKQRQTRAASEWLAGEIEKLRKKVAAAESKVEDYRSASNLYLGSNNTPLPTQQLTDLNAQIAAARAQKADLEARARQLRAQLKSGGTIQSADIANSDTMRRLIEQRIALRSQLAEQSTTLLGRHPRIQELKAQIAETDRLIAAEGERLARQLENDAKVAGSRIQTLTASLDQVKEMASQNNEQDVKLRALQRDAKTERDLLESYLGKYREATARDSINAAPPDARIISRATASIAPAYPKKLPTVLIAAFAGFALSVGFTVTGALLGSSPNSYPARYAAAVYPVSGRATAAAPSVVSPSLAPAGGLGPRPQFAATPGLVPRPGSAPDTPLEPDGGHALHPVGQIDEIAQKLRQMDDGGRRVAVIGTGRNVGTTFAAITLARAFASDSTVVLVDLAFSAPNLAVISTEPDAPGVAELVRGTASFGDAITSDQFSDVHLVATGAVDGDGEKLADSPMLATVVEALSRSYDHVVLDVGSAADIAVERFTPFAGHAVLVSADPAAGASRAVRDQLKSAGFEDVVLLAGGGQAVAA